MGNGKRFGTIVEIGDILISEEVILEFFACDYPVCKGQCCIIGESGAPLKEEELDPIEANYDVFAPLMRPEGRQAVEEKGFFEIDRDGDLVTPLVPGSEECAFCLFEDGNCFCSMGSRPHRPEPAPLGHLSLRLRKRPARGNPSISIPQGSPRPGFRFRLLRRPMHGGGEGDQGESVNPISFRAPSGRCWPGSGWC